MTLIEIMIVVVLLAMVAGGTVYSINALTRSHLRAACMKIVAAARFSYSRSVTQGSTVRIALDFENDQMAIEEAHGRVTLTRATDPRAARDDEESEDDGSSVDPWAAAEARLSETLQPGLGASPFQPVAGRDGSAMSRYQMQPVGRGVQIVRLISPHEPEPRERGRGSIYFFPQGRGEHSVVHLSDGGEQIYSVEIHPLTGRGKVHPFAFEPDEILDEDHSEVEDPG